MLHSLWHCSLPLTVHLWLLRVLAPRDVYSCRLTLLSEHSLPDLLRVWSRLFALLVACCPLPFFEISTEHPGGAVEWGPWRTSRSPAPGGRARHPGWDRHAWGWRCTARSGHWGNPGTGLLRKHETQNLVRLTVSENTLPVKKYQTYIKFIYLFILLLSHTAVSN